GISFMIGHAAHVITDAGDTVGTMWFFPWTHHFAIGAWAYAGQTGRFTDAAAYFSGLGGMWDLFWILYGLFSWRVITRDYFETVVFNADALWPRLNKRLPKDAPPGLSPGAFFYACCPWRRAADLGRQFHTYPP